VIELLPGMPPGTVGFRVTGDIKREDYQRVLEPELRKALDSGDGLRSLYMIQDLDRIEPAALWEDMKTTFDAGIRHHNQWKRSAIVTDIEWMAQAAKLFTWMIPGEARVFGRAEIDEAKRWVAGTSGP
jgi:hypothetical protein